MYKKKKELIAMQPATSWPANHTIGGGNQQQAEVILMQPVPRSEESEISPS